MFVQTRKVGATKTIQAERLIVQVLILFEVSSFVFGPFQNIFYGGDMSLLWMLGKTGNLRYGSQRQYQSRCLLLDKQKLGIAIVDDRYIVASCTTMKKRITTIKKELTIPSKICWSADDEWGWVNVNIQSEKDTEIKYKIN
jgi:hypothetical protein